jgi:1-acyl-sn-glycerol-3-phosphate acyltransferase
MRRGQRIPFGRRFWGAVLRALILLLSHLEVRGRENLPVSGAGIVYYNHIHWLDPVLFCGSCRRYAVPLAKIESRDWPVVGWLLQWYHVIFITRGVVDRDALKATWQVLADGDIAVISPEGTRSLDGVLQPAKEGLAFIARHEPGAWLMPCAVTGTTQFSWSVERILRRPQIVLTYGRAFRLRWPNGKVDRDVLREMTDEAMLHLAACLPPEMRGTYGGNSEGTEPSVGAGIPGAAPGPRWLEFLDRREGDQ